MNSTTVSYLLYVMQIYFPVFADVFFLLYLTISLLQHSSHAMVSMWLRHMCQLLWYHSEQSTSCCDLEMHTSAAALSLFYQEVSSFFSLSLLAVSSWCLIFWCLIFHSPDNLTQLKKKKKSGVFLPIPEKCQKFILHL